MKKQLLVMAALCAIGFTSNAQTEKGKNLIGGSLSFSTNNIENSNLNQEINYLSIIPSYAHFFSKNLAIGLAIGANHSKMTSTSFDTFYNTQNTTVNKTRSYDISPLLRYYVDINEKFKIFGQFNAGIGFGKSSQISSIPGGFDANVKTTTYSAGIKSGIAIFPSKKIAIELGFTLFSYAKSGNNASGTQLTYNYKMENFNFGFNSFTPNLGVNFHF